MTTYPYAIDNDASIIRIDNNLSQLGDQAINQLRDAVFVIETTLGITPAGTLSSVADRLAVSLNPNGTIKASALTSVGLATLPITNVQVANNAGILESKLTLNHSTTNLFTRIVANEATLNTLAAYTVVIDSDLRTHIAGGTILTDSTPARHVASQIDLNAVPNDPRDVAYIWSGLIDKNGNPRTATQLASGLLQVNDALTTHENATSVVHPATAVSVDTTDFNEIPFTATNVQLALEAIDQMDTLATGEHRQSQHSNGIPKKARSQVVGLDGYSQELIPPTPCETFLTHGVTFPYDSNVVGDDLIKFNPTTGTDFEAQFTQVRVGDIVRVAYGNGISAVFTVESVRYVPGSEWFVRINGINLYDSANAVARIDRKLFDENTYGVLACAASNENIYHNIMGSVIVGNPRGATALGLGFDPNKLTSTCYKLWLQLYPTGNPVDSVVDLPFIDVTGNAGATPGSYTIDSVVQTTNNALRAAGYNYRFIAFSRNDEFGIMLADAIDNAAFSIVTGTVVGTSVVAGTYTENAASFDERYDALGFGPSRAGLAGPSFPAVYGTDLAAANYPIIVIPALKNRNYVVNGVRRDTFAPTYKANIDGYWQAEIVQRTVVPGVTVVVKYRVDMDLDAAELKIGKTIVVQPDISPYNDVDYGRFIIRDVEFVPACGPIPAYTDITVVNGIHGTGIVDDATSAPVGTLVRLYFGEDSVSFNYCNAVDSIGTSVYIRNHEIYVDENGETFSHERARMAIQAWSAGNLNTGTIWASPWKITDVSPKLRGYRNAGATDFRTYVRFFVIDYDTTAGWYDGYIGNLTGTLFGETVRARKGDKARFYDNTNVDYIELQYTELNAVSTAIVVTAPEIIDIEVFPALATDEEVMRIGRVNLNNNIVSYVDSDVRQFGNVSEKDFSDSAIDFIEAGERYLHANGVLRGLDYVGVSGAQFSFTGGAAIVNGHVLAVNDSFVQIPEIRDSAAPDIVTWAICLNENGLLEPIIITTTQSQFFAVNVVPNYYVQSVTFPELIATRKDLLPLLIVPVTIASFTPGTPLDARRYVNDETLNIPLTLATEGLSSQPTNFRTFEQMKTWYRYYKGVGNVVINVRGAVTIDTETLTGIDYWGMVLQGGYGASLTIDTSLSLMAVTLRDLIVQVSAGAVINLYSQAKIEDCIVDMAGSDRGIVILGDSVSITGNTISYTPVTSIVAGDYIGTGNGAIYGAVTTNNKRKQTTIKNCSFISPPAVITRPPFINFEIQAGVGFVGGALENTIISENNFYDGTAFNYAAIAVVGLAGTSNNPIIIDLNIADNTCSSEQGIYLTTNSWTYQPIVIDCKIKGNSCGGIGYNVTNGVSAYTSFTANYKNPGSLLIDGNTTSAIGSVLADATNTVPTSGSLSVTTGNVIISNNFTRGMKLPYKAAVRENSSLLVSANMVESGDMTSLPPAFQYTSGIVVYTGASVYDGYSCIIADNTVRQGSGTFINGIYCGDCYADIHGNAVSGFTYAGILVSGYGNVQNNRITRGNTTVTNYILISRAGVIVDNWLDGYTVDVGLTDWVSSIAAPAGSVVERNKNHRRTKYLTSSRGIFTDSVYHDGYYKSSLFTEIIRQVNTAVSGSFRYAFVFYYDSDNGTVTFNYMVPLGDCFPEGSRIVKVSMDIQVSAVPDTGTFSMTLLGGDFYSGAPDQDVSNTVTLSFPPALINTTYTATINTDGTRDALNGSDDICLVAKVDSLSYSTNTILYLSSIYVDWIY